MSDKPKQSELTIITKAKDLCSYVVTVTHKSPKLFRFTFITRLCNLSMDIIDKVYRANEIFIGEGASVDDKRMRIDLQRQALTDIKILAYFSEISMTSGCITMKQYEQIASKSAECQRLLGGWMASDKKR